MGSYRLTALNYPGKVDLSPGFTRLGRAPSNDFRVGDASVSALHCEIELSHEGLVVRDLGSTNGTFVDEALVTEAPLSPGQFLRLGAIEFKLEIAPEEEPVYTPATQPRILLADGLPACQQHKQTHAQHECDRCKGAYCENCVRILRRTGGANLVFCQNCGGPCHPVPGAPQQPSAKPSTLLGRLTQTMRLKG